MQKDFHYYAAYAAACLAGYSHEEALTICYCDQFTDDCTATLLKNLGGPAQAATTQLQTELLDARTDILGLQNITRIWASFHFLPYDLNAPLEHRGRAYKNKYRLICNSNSELAVKTVELAKDKSLQAIGLAMHVISDTWAHKYFAGTPSLVINNTNYHFYEILEDGSERQIRFRHSVSSPDDVEQGLYTGSIYQGKENNIMNLGHGRAGHLPDYSFAVYRYLPAWGNYEEIIKDNPSDYLHAFGQIVCAMQYLRGTRSDFPRDCYAFDVMEPYMDEIDAIIRKRQLDACEDWKALGEKISGHEIPDYDIERYWDEYKKASSEDKDETFLGRFFSAAIAQKGMVTHSICTSGNTLAGFSKIGGKR